MGTACLGCGCGVGLIMDDGFVVGGCKTRSYSGCRSGWGQFLYSFILLVAGRFLSNVLGPCCLGSCCG